MGSRRVRVLWGAGKGNKGAGCWGWCWGFHGNFGAVSPFLWGVLARSHSEDCFPLLPKEFAAVPFLGHCLKLITSPLSHSPRWDQKVGKFGEHRKGKETVILAGWWAGTSSLPSWNRPVVPARDPVLKKKINEQINKSQRELGHSLMVVPLSSLCWTLGSSPRTENTKHERVSAQLTKATNITVKIFFLIPLVSHFKKKVKPARNYV